MVNYQNFVPSQTDPAPAIGTLASAATIYPTTFITNVTGTTTISTVTPPLPGIHSLVLLFTNAAPGDISDSGNVLLGASNILENSPVALLWNPILKKYHIMSVG